jgi:hypothetical protein
MIHERHTCRACGSRQLSDILDLGNTALANDFLDPSEVTTAQLVLPLSLRLCRDCSLVQLAGVVDPGVLYSRYAYVTSTSRTMDTHLEEQCRHLLATGTLRQSPRVLEIASNTGLYLKKFQARGCEVLGVEPARNIAELAERAGVPTWIDLFNSPNAAHIRNEWGQADLVLGRHVLAHIDDWRDLFAGLETITHADSLIAFEVPYLADFLSGPNSIRFIMSTCPTSRSGPSRHCCCEPRFICSGWTITRFMAGPSFCKSGIARRIMPSTRASRRTCSANGVCNWRSRRRGKNSPGKWGTFRRGFRN